LGGKRSGRPAKLRVVTALLGLVPLTATAAAQNGRHVALVVGIGEYRELRGIVRPAGDARAVHDRLSRLGFIRGARG